MTTSKRTTTLKKTVNPRVKLINDHAKSAYVKFPEVASQLHQLACRVVMKVSKSMEIHQHNDATTTDSMPPIIVRFFQSAANEEETVIRVPEGEEES